MEDQVRKPSSTESEIKAAETDTSEETEGFDIDTDFEYDGPVADEGEEEPVRRPGSPKTSFQRGTLVDDDS